MTTNAWNRNRFLTVALGALAATLVLSQIGCGPRRAAVHPVQGEVVDAQGRPAEGAVVVFHPVDGGDDPIRPVGHVDASGVYRLTTYELADGAPVGNYAITVTWPTPQTNPFEANGDRLQGRYSRPENAIMQVEIQPGENRVPQVRLP